MKLLMCNLKANLNLPELEEYLKKINGIKNKESLVIFPSNLYLGLMSKYDIVFGSQNVSIFNETNSTGEVTAKQIKSTNATYTIIGHSERREKLKEDEYIISKKIRNALDNNLKVVYCIGETKEEKARHKTFQILEKQIAKIFNHISEDDAKKIIIAYEPVWAIGNGNPAKSDEIDEITIFIKKIMMDYYNINSMVLYGGSVNSENINNFNKLKYVDGFLIGSASLNPDEVMNMLQKINK